MALQQCEFCRRPYDPGAVSASGRHPCCGIRPAGEMTGRIEGTCRIIGELGRGATGTVYLAQQLRLQRNAALKLMTANALDDQKAAKLFFSEVRAAGKLIHPNIARIYTAGETDDQRPYAVMEFVEGRTLEEALGRLHPFSPEEVCRIALAIANALHYAWRTAGLTHGDLKPANIMLRHDDDSVCILDMGLQAARQENDVQSAIGTPLYAAPELVNADFGENDFHADIYSLGIMMYEMLAGTAPFDGTPVEILRQHQSMDAPSVRQQVPDVPEKLAKLIDRMLQRFAADRPSWPAVIKDLKELADNRHSAAPPPAAPSEQKKHAPQRWSTGKILASLFLAVLLSGLSGYTLARKTAPPQLQKEQKTVGTWQKQQAFRLAEQGKTSELREMLQEGFPINSENKQGNTLLMQAVFFGKQDTVRMLLEFSPDLRHRNRRGETAREMAGLFPEIQQLLNQ